MHSSLWHFNPGKGFWLRTLSVPLITYILLSGLPSASGVLEKTVHDISDTRIQSKCLECYMKCMKLYIINGYVYNGILNVSTFILTYYLLKCAPSRNLYECHKVNEVVRGNSFSLIFWQTFLLLILDIQHLHYFVFVYLYWVKTDVIDEGIMQLLGLGRWLMEHSGMCNVYENSSAR